MGKKTYVAMVLDESGSMRQARDLTINNFNEQVESLVKGSVDGMETFVSLYTFSCEAKAVLKVVPVSEMRKLTDKNYSPDGRTAMYDAVGMAINDLNAIEVSPQDDVAFLIVIFSDGQENNSRQFDQPTIAEMVQSVQAKGNWTVTYMGAVHDLDKLCADLNLLKGNVTTVDVSSLKGYSDGMTRTTKSMGAFMSCRASGASAVMSFYNGEK